MVLLAVCGAMLGVGLPALRSFISSVQLTAATNDLLGGLLLARSEAARRHMRVALCTSPDGEACAVAGGWDQGWIVFADENNNGRRDVGEAVFGRAQPLSGQLQISGNQPVARYISYTPLGNTRLASGALQSGTITFCAAAGTAADARQIILSADGRPRVARRPAAVCA